MVVLDVMLVLEMMLVLHIISTLAMNLLYAVIGGVNVILLVVWLVGEGCTGDYISIILLYFAKNVNFTYTASKVHKLQ